MSSDTVRFSILAGRAPPKWLAVRVGAATIASGLRLSGSQRCNADLAAKLVYVPAILARSSA